MKEEVVVLVTESDEAIGTMEKMEAHRRGELHRAFSVFVFNHQNEMLLQRRALSKYHSAGLWTNACCSHPRPDEAVETAAKRRLTEELGFSAPLQKVFDFIYRITFSNSLTEYEFDHVFVAWYNGAIFPNPAEVMDCRYQSLDEISITMKRYPERYTEWFRIAFPKIVQWKQEFE